MTIDECIAKAAADIDIRIADSIDDTEDLMRAHGATQDELDSFMEKYRRDLQEWRAEYLAKLRGWLLRDGESLQ